MKWQYIFVIITFSVITPLTRGSAQMIGTQAARKFMVADESLPPVMITVKAPVTVSLPYAMTLPDGPPTTDGYLLSSTAGGVLSWIDPSALSSIGTITHGITLSGTADVSAPLEINLANANAWTGTQSFPATSEQGNVLIASINVAGTTIFPALIGAGLSNAQVNDNLTISGGTIENTPIGTTIASAGRFTSISVTSLPTSSSSTAIVTSNNGTLETRITTTTNNSNAIVLRDGGGGFSAGTITANLLGNVTGNVTGSATSLSGTLAVGNGGTGVQTLPSNGVLYGNGTGAVQVTAASSSGGQFLTSVTTGAAPTWGSPPMIVAGNCSVEAACVRCGSSDDSSPLARALYWTFGARVLSGGASRGPTLVAQFRQPTWRAPFIAHLTHSNRS